MFILQIGMCRGEKGEVRVPDKEAYQYWADYADALLLGEDLGVDVPDAAADSHYCRISLVYASDLAPEQGHIAYQVYQACDHAVQIMAGETVQSRLYVPPGVKT